MSPIEKDELRRAHGPGPTGVQAARLEALGTLAGGIAHDFNNLLAVILGSVDLARSRLGKGKSPEADLDRIEGACLRARDLVRQILNFARSSPEAPGPLAPVPLIKETLKLFRATLPREIALRIRCAEEAERVRVGTDPSRLQQILLNLCANAAQAMGGRGVLSCLVDVVPSGREETPFLLVRVADTGPGFDPALGERLFEPFFTTKGNRGTGLGLSIVREAVREARGSVTARNEPEGGASFTVLLPTLGESEEQEAPEAGAPCGRGERLLCVEEDPELRSLLEKILAGLGYETEFLPETGPCLDRLRERPRDYDLVLVNARNPGHLRSFVEAVASLRGDLPVLAMSGSMPEEELPRSVRAFLPKPSTSGEIARTIRAILDGPALDPLPLRGPQKPDGGEGKTRNP
jgi:CheY-like chemotaxis protein